MKSISLAGAAALVFTLAACGGGGGNNGTASLAPPNGPVPTIPAVLSGTSNTT